MNRISSYSTVAITDVSEYKNILIGMDCSDESLKAASSALSIATKYGSTVTALYIIHTSYINRFNPLPEEEKEDAKHLQKAKEDLDKWIKAVSQKVDTNKNTNVKIEVIESTQPIYSEILEYAESNMNDLIVIGSRGRTGFNKLLLGSVASGVVTYSHCPVLVVR